MANRPNRRKLLRLALKQRGLTLTAFAESLGVSRPHLYLVLTGKRKSPRIEAAVAAQLKQRVA